MTKEIMSVMQDKMGKSVAVLKREFGSLRAGRATPQLLDRISVDYYGTDTPLNQVANIAIPEARVITISPWESRMITPIEKAIQKSDLGINPSNDGKVIRLVFPELTEERRRDLVKVVKKKGEEAKVAIRSIRRDANETIKKQKKNGDITEDDQKIMEEDAQKATDASIKDIDKIIADKEKEIMEV